MALLVRAGIGRWLAFFNCIALASRLSRGGLPRRPASRALSRLSRGGLRLERARKSLAVVARVAVATGRGRVGDSALRSEKIFDRRADKIDLGGGVVRTDGEAEHFVGEPFGEREIAALPAGGAVGV